MSAPYCGKRVKVFGTQRSDLNGLEGVAAEFDASTGRYLVSLSGSRTVALKPANLQPLGDAGAGASMPQASRGNPFSGFPSGMNMNSPQMEQARQQAQMLLNRFIQLLPPGVDPQKALLGLSVFAFAVAYIVGFFRAIPILGWLTFLLIHGLPVFKRQNGGIEGAKAALRAVGEKLSVELSKVSGTNISANNGYIAACVATGLSLFTFSSSLAAMFISPMAPASAYTADSSHSEAIVTLAEAYKRGFDAGSSGQAYVNPFEETSSYSNSYASEMPYSAPSGSSGFDLTKLLPVLLAGRMIYTLGKVGDAPWNMQLMLQNLEREPLWKKAVMGLVFFRLFF